MEEDEDVYKSYLEKERLHISKEFDKLIIREAATHREVEATYLRANEVEVNREGFGPNVDEPHHHSLFRDPGPGVRRDSIEERKGALIPYYNALMRATDLVNELEVLQQRAFDNDIPLGSDLENRMSQLAKNLERTLHRFASKSDMRRAREWKEKGRIRGLPSMSTEYKEKYIARLEPREVMAELIQQPSKGKPKKKTRQLKLKQAIPRNFQYKPTKDCVFAAELGCHVYDPPKYQKEMSIKFPGDRHFFCSKCFLRPCIMVGKRDAFFEGRACGDWQDSDLAQKNAAVQAHAMMTKYIGVNTMKRMKLYPFEKFLENKPDCIECAVDRIVDQYESADMSKKQRAKNDY